MPLLARKVENILVFANTGTVFNKASGDLYNDVERFFGIVDKKAVGCNPEVIDLKKGYNPCNTVFDHSKLDELRKKFTALKEREEPLVHCDEYSVKKNVYYGLDGDANYRPRICWVYLDRTGQWIQQIKTDPTLPQNRSQVLEDLVGRSGSFKTFPNFLTFFEAGLEIVRLDKILVNAASNLTAWTVFESKSYLAKELRLMPSESKKETVGDSSPARK